MAKSNEFNIDGGNFKNHQKPKPIKIKKDLENSSRFKVPIPVRISSLSDDKIYSEYKYTTHSKTKTNKLATSY